MADKKEVRSPESGDKDELKCPKGFSPDTWAIMSIGNQRGYLRAIEHSKKLTQKGGEK